MRAPNLPGYVADSSLVAARGRYWSPAGAVPGAAAGPAVIPQARLGGSGGFGGFGGSKNGFWCEVGCNVAFAACAAACSATGPAAPGCVIVCSLLYQLCDDGC